MVLLLLLFSLISQTKHWKEEEKQKQKQREKKELPVLFKEANLVEKVAKRKSEFIERRGSKKERD